MPFASRTVNNKLETINRKRLKFQVSSFKFLVGFSLIELMIVVTLFGVAASLVTASYLNFERNNRVKSAATSLKSDLRLVQNKASSGDKGPAGACAGTSTLGGWYLKIQSGLGQNSYSIGGVCVAPVTFTETSFERRTVKLQTDLIVNKITYVPAPDPSGQTLPVAIFFRPLVSGVSYLDAGSVFTLGDETAPDFFDGKGVFFANKAFNPPPSSAVTIELSDSTQARKYLVKIEPTGEINEAKP